jgi:hypothetical protein
MNRYIGTIIDRMRWMRLIRQHHKTCEIKSRRVVIPKSCKHMVFHANKKLRAGGFTHHLIARLLTHTPLGPFSTAKAVMDASRIYGSEFKTGMSEESLDRFIQRNASKEVYIYRFEEARVSHSVVWSNRPGNNNAGFLPMFNRKAQRVRFTVLEPAPDTGAGTPTLPPRWRPLRALPPGQRLPPIPRLPTHYDLTAESEPE